MKIEELIKNFLEAIAKPSGTPVEVNILIKCLDLLACSIHECKFEFDDSEHPEPPEKNTPKLEKL